MEKGKENIAKSRYFRLYLSVSNTCVIKWKCKYLHSLEYVAFRSADNLQYDFPLIIWFIDSFLVYNTSFLYIVSQKLCYVLLILSTD